MFLIQLYKRIQLVVIGGRSLVMRMLSNVQISLFTITYSSLSIFVLGHFRNMIEGVAATCHNEY